MKLNQNLQYIIDKYNENRLAHIFLIETNNASSCTKDILEIIKEFNKNHENKNINTMIENGNCPNIYIVEEEEANTINKDKIVDLLEKCSKKPTFLNKNFYIIKNGEKLNISCENCLLKFIEEPQDDIIGFILTSNQRLILDTIRSRCQIIIANYETETIIISDEAKEFLNNVFLSDNLLFLNDFCKKIKERSELSTFLKNLLYIINEAKRDKNYFPGNNLSIYELNELEKKITETIQKNQLNCNYNLNLANLVIEMRYIYGKNVWNRI